MVDSRFRWKVLGGIFIVVTVGFGAEVAYDLSRAVNPETGEPVRLADLIVNAAQARAITSPFARAYNNILALLLTFIALAIPLTANLYTPKLIDIFVKDRVNLFVLSGGAILTAHSILAATLTFDGFVARTAIWVSFAGALIGWTIIIPYYLYVLSFLNPVRIIERVTNLVRADFRAAAAGKYAPDEAQRRVDQSILNLGNVVLRAVERADRDVSVEAIKALVTACNEFEKVKPRIPPRFFVVGEALFTGMSSAAIEILNENKLWVEQKLLNQLALSYNAALAKMPDAVSAISDAVKDLAHGFAKAGAPRELIQLHVRYLNTFLREAVKKKDVHAIYDVYYQFKSLTRKLCTVDPSWAAPLTRYMRYYADFARNSGMPFIYEIASYELAELAEWSVDHCKEASRQFLDAALAMEGAESSVRIVKSRLILATRFIECGLGAELERVRASLARVPATLIEQARREVMDTTDRVFWEVTDRQVNFDFIPESRRALLRDLCDGLTSAVPAAKSAPAPALSEKRA